MSKMHIRSILVSECYTNCYIVMNSETKEGFIVDPGGNELKISTNISSLEMKPMGIILTHGHYDHIEAVDGLRERYGIKVYASKEEEQVLTDKRYNLSSMFGNPMTTKADVYLNDGQEFELAGFDIKFIHTPGHTQGSGCFYVKDENVLFSGDTLFRASLGRTDFPGGSEAAILKSIREKLLTLPSETDVFAGHMEQTTIGDEKYYY